MSALSSGQDVDLIFPDGSVPSDSLLSTFLKATTMTSPLLPQPLLRFARVKSAPSPSIAKPDLDAQGQ
ncbi:hypothetical protein AC1031_004005 [Aphanomyces cochlioides]|nr:hypothetical protein AC1031_004005 [Aphanomyces cochlioides]